MKNYFNLFMLQMTAFVIITCIVLNYELVCVYAGDEQREELNDSQKETVKSILSKYNPASLTQDDAKAIHRSLKEAGLHGGPAMNEAVKQAGFDPDVLKSLDPPPARKGDKESRDDKKNKVNNNIEPSGNKGENEEAVKNGGSRKNSGRENDAKKGVQKYNIEQAVSDNAQLHTIAFDGLAYITGDFGYDTFLPPGKVSDYFGFQYMRDIDAAGGGHNTSFLTKIAFNMLAVLTDEQKNQLLILAKEQESEIQKFAEMRFPLIKAFRRNLEGNLPAGSNGLDKSAVLKYSASLYELDGKLAFQRAKVMGGIICGLNENQKSVLSKLKFGDSSTWPEQPEQLDKRGMSHTVNVAVMTYASEMFAWYAGSIDADIYFCPERHGMYFGGFGMKTAPAMGKQNYLISTSLTGDSGRDFLALLNEQQRSLITSLVESQRSSLEGIVSTRRAIASELRKFQTGGQADYDKVLSLSRQYGELDGNISYLYAQAFAKVSKTLTAQQKEAFSKIRTSNPQDPKGPFLYSTPISMPDVINTDFLF